MPELNSQEFLFQRIRELIPAQLSLVDTVAEILHISSDSAYRRIRGETPIIMDEARQLCVHFKLSLDQLFQVKTNSLLFEHSRIHPENHNYESFLRGLLDQVNYLDGFLQKEVIYCTKDMPIFHNFYFKPLIAFRYFFWMKTLLQHPDFADSEFSIDCVPPAIEILSSELTRKYTHLPSSEIWNTECINAIISQVEFYRDSGHFASAADIRQVYDAIEDTVLHLKNQVDYGCKFMPEENPDTKKRNFRFFYNRVLLGDNVILISADMAKTVFLNYDALSYISTRDPSFCESVYQDMQHLMKKGTIISGTSEKQRNIFFGILLAKISGRKKYV
jgi:hypothetical protein